MKKPNKLLKSFIIILAVAAAVTGGGAAYLTVNEYRPDETEEVLVSGPTTKPITPGDTVTALTYCIGYGIHDSSFDCRFEGGTMTSAADSDKINENMNPILFNIRSADADIVFLQEVDKESDRSFLYDESEYFLSEMDDYNTVFAEDHLCGYVPQGSLGRVDAGLQILSRLYSMESAQRIALNMSSSWPQSTVSMKNCMLVERVELTDSSKQLVLINLQLTESDNGGEANLEQYKELANFMQMEFAKGNYVIAGGNFNAMLPSVNAAKYPELEGSSYYPSQLPMSVLTGGWKYCTDDSLPTARVCDKPYSEDTARSVQTYVSDGFICSPNTIVEEVKTVDTEFIRAAHNPVSVKVTLVK